MSVSIFRKDFLQLDEFHHDGRTHKSLLPQLTNDLLNNGFNDVGPVITKITLTDKELSKYIHEFICYNYDTSLDNSGKGAYGIKPWDHRGLTPHAPQGIWWTPNPSLNPVFIDTFYNETNNMIRYSIPDILVSDFNIFKVMECTFITPTSVDSQTNSTITITNDNHWTTMEQMIVDLNAELIDTEFSLDVSTFPSVDNEELYTQQDVIDEAKKHPITHPELGLNNPTDPTQTVIDNSSDPGNNVPISMDDVIKVAKFEGVEEGKPKPSSNRSELWVYTTGTITDEVTPLSLSSKHTGFPYNVEEIDDFGSVQQIDMDGTDDYSILFIEHTNIYFNSVSNHPNLLRKNNWYDYISNEFPQCRQNAIGQLKDGSVTIRDTFGGDVIWNLDRISQYEYLADNSIQLPKIYQKTWEDSNLTPPLEDLMGSVWYYDNFNSSWKNRHEELSGTGVFRLGHWDLPEAASLNGTNDGTDAGDHRFYGSHKIFGPNTELFSYLNPYPHTNKDYTLGGVYTYNTEYGKKNNPIRGTTFDSTDTNPTAHEYDTIGGLFDWNPGYHGVGDVGEVVYNNEYVKIKKCITTADRGVVMGAVPFTSDISSNISFQNITKYKEYVNSIGDRLHDFYIIGDHESNFFTPGVVENANQEVILSLGLGGLSDVNQPYGLQLGDVYILHFQTVNILDNTHYTSRVKLNVKDVNTQMLVDDLFIKLLDTNFANTSAGLFSIEKSDIIESAINIVSNKSEYKFLGVGINGSLEHWSYDLTTFLTDINRNGYFDITFTQSVPDEKFLRKEPVTISINVDYDNLFDNTDPDNPVLTPDSVMNNIVETITLSSNWSSNITMNVSSSTTTLELYINTNLSTITIDPKTTNTDATVSEIIINSSVSPYNKDIGGFISDDSGLRFSPARYSIHMVGGVPTNTTLTDKVIDFVSRNKVIGYGTLSTWSGVSGLDTYVNGYIPSIRLGPFDRDTNGLPIDGMMGGESLEFKFTKLVNESLETPWTDTNDGLSFNVMFTADNNMTLIEMLVSIKSTLESEQYIKDYMNVIINGSFIILEYNNSSSAYMVRGSRPPNNYGFLNIPSHYWSTVLGIDSDIISKYNIDSILSDGDVYTSDDTSIFKVGHNYGKVVYGIDYNAILKSDITNIGVDGTTSENYKSPNFDISIDFITRGVRTEDPLDVGFQEVSPYVISGESKIQIQFPYAIDIGTMANSPAVIGGHYYSPLETSLMQYNRTSCKYPDSYKQHVLMPEYQRRSRGPYEGFRDTLQKNHPTLSNTSDNNDDISTWKGASNWTSLADFTSFNKINDYSIGPVVLESDSSSSLSGLDGKQEFRIRFDVVDGEEVSDTSPLIHDSHKDILNNDTNRLFNAKNIVKNYTYLQVNIATKYQLKGDGSVQGITSKSRTSNATRIVRPSGYLGAIRPQFFNYSKSQSHVITSKTNRIENDSNIKSIININDARVGWRGIDWSLNNISAMKRSYIFQNDTNLDNKDTITYSLDNETVKYSQGVLNDGEYKWENSWMTGSSHELVGDLKYNTENERMSRGWFKRSGKNDIEFVGQYPMNYQLTILNHGISLYVTDQGGTHNDDDFAWFIVQRHVDQVTGEPDFASASQPLHCVYMSTKPNLLWSDFKSYFTWSGDSKTGVNVDDSVYYHGLYNRSGEIVNNFWITEQTNSENPEIDIDLQSRFKRFVVRETDVVKPWDSHLYAGIDTIDSHAIINPLEQLSFTEEGKLIINFATRISNQRVIYGTSELDMFAFTDAGSIGEDAYTESVRYGSDKQRTYKGLSSTRPYGNGMRVLFLVDGYGIQDTVGFSVN